MFGFSLKAMTLTALTVGLMVKAQDCTRNATIVEGDTCDSISAKYASSTFQLTLSNPWIDSSCSNLEIGTDVCLGLRGSDCSKIYTVIADDTCLGIEASYGLNETVLFNNNPSINQDCTNIYIGQVLCIDTKSYPYSALVSDDSSVSTESVEPETEPEAETDSESAVPEATASVTESAAVAEETVYQDVWATVTSSSTQPEATSDSTGLEYCEDGDESPECVDEDSLPYCDEI